jgi:hypothetical protein
MPGSPHPQPLSRKGRGGKSASAGDTYKTRHRVCMFSPLPLAGEGLGVRGHPATALPTALIEAVRDLAP